MTFSTWHVPQAFVQNGQWQRQLLQMELVYDDW